MIAWIRNSDRGNKNRIKYWFGLLEIEHAGAPEDGDGMFPQNVVLYLQVHNALQPRRLISTSPTLLVILTLV